MLNHFALQVAAGLLLSLVLLRALHTAKLLRHSVALRPASLLRDSAH